MATPATPTMTMKKAGVGAEEHSDDGDFPYGIRCGSRNMINQLYQLCIEKAEVFPRYKSNERTVVGGPRGGKVCHVTPVLSHDY